MPSDAYRVAVITPEDELWEATSRRLSEHDLISERLSSPLGQEGRKVTERVDAVLVDEREVDVGAAIRAWLRAGWIDRNCPVLVISPDPPDRDRHLEWLRGGAWGVLRTPVDAELLAVQLQTMLRSTRSDDEGRPAQADSPYAWPALLRATDETLALAERYDRPVSCIAITLDWPDGAGAPPTDDVLQRLTGPAQLAVRRYDMVGVSRTGALLVVLPETDADGADRFRQRAIPLLEDHLRAWGILARLRSSVVSVRHGASEVTGSEFLLDAARSAS